MLFARIQASGPLWHEHGYHVSVCVYMHRSHLSPTFAVQTHIAFNIWLVHRLGNGLQTCHVQHLPKYLRSIILLFVKSFLDTVKRTAKWTLFPHESIADTFPGIWPGPPQCPQGPEVQSGVCSLGFALSAPVRICGNLLETRVGPPWAAWRPEQRVSGAVPLPWNRREMQAGGEYRLKEDSSLCLSHFQLQGRPHT